MVTSLIRTARILPPQSPERRASITVAARGGLGAGATASSRSRKTSSSAAPGPWRRTGGCCQGRPGRSGGGGRRGPRRQSTDRHAPGGPGEVRRAPARPSMGACPLPPSTPIAAHRRAGGPRAGRGRGPRDPPADHRARHGQGHRDRPDGTVRVDVWLTVAGCPLRDTITRDVTAAVSSAARGHAGRGRARRDERRAAQGAAGPAARRSRPEREIPFAKPGSLTRVYAIACGQGRRRQVVGHGQPGRGDGRAGAEGRRRRRRHLRPLGAAHARRDRPPHPGRADDHAADRRTAWRSSRSGCSPRATRRSCGAARCCTARCSSSSPTSTGATWTSCCMDLPPGTGDIAISVAQLVPDAELLVVTTPQLAAAEVAERAGAIAMQTHQRIAGVIENMSCLPVPALRRAGRAVRHGGGPAVADSLTRTTGTPVPLLGQIPIDVRLREGGDTGVPLVLSDPGSPAGQQLSSIAASLAAAAAWSGASSASHPSRPAGPLRSGGLVVVGRALGGIHRMSPRPSHGTVSTPSRSSSRCLRTKCFGFRSATSKSGNSSGRCCCRSARAFSASRRTSRSARPAAGPSWAAGPGRRPRARSRRAPAAW